jgi:hypothetical protein
MSIPTPTFQTPTPTDGTVESFKWSVDGKGSFIAAADGTKQLFEVNLHLPESLFSSKPLQMAI